MKSEEESKTAAHYISRVSTRTAAKGRRGMGRLRLLFPLGGIACSTHDIPAPFFIIGSGRSGNTLLRKLLCETEGIHIPPETYVLGKSIQSFSGMRHLSWEEIVLVTVGYFEFSPHRDTFGVSFAPAVDELLCLPKEKRTFAAILDHVYRFHAHAMDVSVSRWGDKTPLNVYWLPEIDCVFPSAQYIHIVRDGVDVACSYVRSNLYQSLEEAAMRWRSSVRLAEKFQSRRSQRCLTVRYEDLVKEPEVILARVRAFLDIASWPLREKEPRGRVRLGDVEKLAHHANVMKPVIASQIGAGRRELTPEESRILTPLINADLRRLGYPIVKV